MKMLRRSLCALTSAGLLASAQAQTANPDYDVVKEYLDEGGTLYLYADTENLVNGIFTRIEQWMETLPPREAAQVGMGVGIGRAATQAIGLGDIDDLGVSIMPLEGGDIRMRQFLHVAGEPGVFELLPPEGTSLSTLDLIPANADFASVHGYRFDRVIPVAEKIGRAAAGEMAVSQINQTLTQIEQQTGINAREALASLDGEAGMWFRFGEPITASDGTILPHPKFVFFAETRDDTLFRQIRTAMQDSTDFIETRHATGALMLKESAANQMNMQVVMTQIDNVFYVASTDDTLREALLSRADETSLFESDTLSNLMDDAPPAYSSFSYVGPSFEDNLTAALSGNGRQQMPARMSLLTQLSLPQERPAVTWREVTPDGVLWTTRGEIDASAAFGWLAGPMMTTFSPFTMPMTASAQARENTSRVRADLRSMATAIESYYIDNNRYPAWTTDPGKRAPIADINREAVPTFQVRDANQRPGLMTLTTPIAYMTSYFPDPFQNEPNATFAYYSVGGDGTGSPTWLLFSPGPDEDWDLDWTQLRPGGYDANYSVFAPYTYDPTNGTVSGGDVWRLKQ